MVLYQFFWKKKPFPLVHAVKNHERCYKQEPMLHVTSTACPKSQQDKVRTFLQASCLMNISEKPSKEVHFTKSKFSNADLFPLIQTPG